jgi:hypothetical protein
MLRPVMAGIVKYVEWMWAFGFAVEMALFVLMAARKHYRDYPAFFSYIGVDLLQSFVLFAVYARWGFSSTFALYLAWGTQGVVLCARAVAVVELCRRLLGQYFGIWALARHILISCAILVALYAALSPGWRWDQRILRADRGLELTIGVVIVILFLFARYYEIVAEPAVRAVAVGFFLFSCFSVVNDTILHQRLAAYDELWRVLRFLTAIASMLLWLFVFRKPLPASAPRPALLPGEIYRALAPEVNLRLRRLNEQLSKLGQGSARRS